MNMAEKESPVSSTRCHVFFQHMKYKYSNIQAILFTFVFSFDVLHGEYNIIKMIILARI